MPGLFEGGEDLAVAGRQRLGRLDAVLGGQFQHRARVVSKRSTMPSAAASCPVRSTIRSRSCPAVSPISCCRASTAPAPAPAPAPGRSCSPTSATWSEFLDYADGVQSVRINDGLTNIAARLPSMPDSPAAAELGERLATRA
uniref:Uncharacterized protein n=1 Tax=Streptomyces sp. NBC_00003 TaxID=2903608 RepID=A0AAU2UW11_9ACTN